MSARVRPSNTNGLGSRRLRSNWTSVALSNDCDPLTCILRSEIRSTTSRANIRASFGADTPRKHRFNGGSALRSLNRSRISGSPRRPRPGDHGPEPHATMKTTERQVTALTVRAVARLGGRRTRHRVRRLRADAVHVPHVSRVRSAERPAAPRWRRPSWEAPPAWCRISRLPWPIQRQWRSSSPVSYRTWRANFSRADSAAVWRGYKAGRVGNPESPRDEEVRLPPRARRPTPPRR